MRHARDGGARRHERHVPLLRRTDPASVARRLQPDRPLSQHQDPLEIGAFEGFTDPWSIVTLSSVTCTALASLLPPLILTVEPFVDVPTIVYSVPGSSHVQFPDPMLYVADLLAEAVCRTDSSIDPAMSVSGMNSSPSPDWPSPKAEPHANPSATHVAHRAKAMTAVKRNDTDSALLSCAPYSSTADAYRSPNPNVRSIIRSSNSLRASAMLARLI